jgi:putative hydrolase of the HAD superfamily
MPHLPKVLLIDADGVLLINEKIFSHQYAEEQGIEAEQLEPFFHGAFRQATVGKADLKGLIAAHRDLWQWEGTADELMDKWFAAESNVDKKLVAILQSIRAAGTKVYLTTDQEKYRAAYLREKLFEDQLDGFFVSCDLGYEKIQPEFWRAVLHRLPGIKPSEIIYFDDSLSKVDAARAAGIDARLYTDRTQVEDLLGSK